ncbi:hypothetical protein GURKE_04790 [Brevundimonas phage vB_BpoS-Gurke]|uniref:Uncharacterized protein n=1 Tax=Brevundimonas phage vB_BpoS-Gurke TaxID=2948599 RepID=A0A9E7N257_9CAUD|nr:hypothetical protein GURKE_04790 [Brevundimonas phage vB_BpoS-Gurke]
MQLVDKITAACPFGLEKAAQRVADEVKAAYDAAPCPLSRAFGRSPIITVVPLPPETPYGPWWAVQVQAGAEIRYIAN